MKNESDVEAQDQATRATIDRFNEALNRHDADALAALLTDDTVFEDTSPAPDGRRIEGKPAASSSGADGSAKTRTHILRPRK